MLSRVARITAAVLSGVTASLLVTAATAQAAQEKPVVVYAEPQEGIYTEKVSYRDLNLAVKADQKTLGRRVGGAVRRVCTDANAFGTYADPVFRDCANDSWDNARPQIARAIARAEQLAASGQPSVGIGAIAVTASR
jgi:UrcA family protein